MKVLCLILCSCLANPHLCNMLPQTHSYLDVPSFLDLFRRSLSLLLAHCLQTRFCFHFLSRRSMCLITKHVVHRNSKALQAPKVASSSSSTLNFFSIAVNSRQYPSRISKLCLVNPNILIFPIVFSISAKILLIAPDHTFIFNLLFSIRSL